MRNRVKAKISLLSFHGIIQGSKNKWFNQKDTMVWSVYGLPSNRLIVPCELSHLRPASISASFQSFLVLVLFFFILLTSPWHLLCICSTAFARGDQIPGLSSQSKDLKEVRIRTNLLLVLPPE